MPEGYHSAVDVVGDDVSVGLSVDPPPELEAAASGGSLCGGTEKGKSAGSGGGSDGVPVKLRIVSIDSVNDFANDSRDSISREVNSPGMG
jgi:hypothetical protein